MKTTLTLLVWLVGLQLSMAQGLGSRAEKLEKWHLNRSAYKAYSKAIALNPTNIHLRYKRAQLAENRLQWYDKALEDYLVITENSTEYCKGSRGVARTLSNMNRNLDAIEVYLECMETCKVDGEEFYMELAQSYQKLDRYNEAIEAYLKALVYNPKDDYIHFAIGYDYLLMDDLTKAEPYLLRSRELNPNESTTLFNLAYLYFYSNKFEQASFYAKEAAKLGDKEAKIIIEEIAVNDNRYMGKDGR